MIRNSISSLVWRAISVVLRPILHVWLRASQATWDSLPRPLDYPRAHSSGTDPDRLLLIGNGAAVGYGVLSHDLALAGALARGLTALTTRAADIDVVADSGLTAETCLERLRTVQLGRYDALVTTIGVNETFELAPLRRWAEQLREMLVYLRHNAPDSLDTFIVGIPPVESIDAFPPLLRTIWNAHARQLNAISERLCAPHPRITFVPFAPAGARDTARYRSKETYAAWADLIAGQIAPALSAECTRLDQAGTEQERQAALDALGILDTDRDSRFDLIVATASSLLGTTGSAISFIDNDRQWTKAFTGGTRPDAARTLAICNLTIQSDQPTIIPDLSADTAWRDHPLVAGSAHMRFYAGYPIEAPDGHRIGALCVMDTRPRQFDERDVALLRDLALRVQRQIAISAAKLPD